MERDKNTSVIIFSVAIIVATIVAAYTVNSYWQKKLTLEAIQGCAEAASNSDPTGGFNGAVYQVCIRDKGYETNLR